MQIKLYVDYKTPDTLEEFLKMFFTTEKGNITSLNHHSTYYDEECTKVQCRKYKRRSFDDVYNLTTTYFPNLSLEELINCLITLFLKEGYYLNCGYCPIIHRPTIVYLKGMAYDIGYGWNEKTRHSDFSWRDVFKSINIHSYKQYIQHVKEQRKILTSID